MDVLILRADLGGMDFSDVSTGEAIPPVTPGVVLRLEFMEPLGLSAHALAKATDVPTNRITAILHGTRSITADTALRLGRHFRTSAEFWMHLQAAHDLETARGNAVGAMNAGDTIKVMKEDLVVGKREVEAGGVRVTSHVVETPVQEQVTLHEERVTIERRPVNQRVAGTEVLRDQTIEARATAEEAVVGKDVRVVEEIGIRKEAADRVETVRDTVRRTEIDVENTSNLAMDDWRHTRDVTGARGGKSKPR